MNERYILGTKINDITMDEALTYARGFLSGQEPKYIVTPNSEICLRGLANHDLQLISRKADLALPDSFGLKIGGFILGQYVNNRVTGIDFSLRLFELAEQNKNSVMLVGGKNISGLKALEQLKIEHPNLKSFYLNGGFFNEQGDSEFPDFIEQINTVKPDILLVNLGFPKQERFIAKYKNHLNVKLLLGVGGTVDYLSGIAQRAPKLVRSLGFEWLHRITHRPKDEHVFNPRSIRRIFNAILFFPLACLVWRITSSIVYKQNAVGFIINSKKEILLVRRGHLPGENVHSEYWQLPQGGVEKNESIEQAVLREMSEEVGLSKLVIRDKVLKCKTYKLNGFSRSIMPFKGKIQSLFLLENIGDQPVKLDQYEVIDYRWVSAHHILNLAHPLKRDIIQIGLNKFKDYV